MDHCFLGTPEFTFTLPDLNMYGNEFRKFLEKDLIEKSTLLSLEQSGRLNWWTDNGNGHGHELCQRLWPLATTGDGNCLLHAASLAIWGFHDRLLTLRRALHTYLENSEHKEPLYRRWRWQQTKLNEQSGFVYSETEWAKEWQNIINMASTEPRRNDCVSSTSSTEDRCANDRNVFTADYTTPNNTYESLEEIHVLALAHVLRRPIIVVADVMLKDMNNEPFAPIPFGGVYLPLECSPKECHRSPLLLTYDMAHFSALVAMENSAQQKDDKLRAVIPLTDSDGVLLQLQFSVDPGPDHNWNEPQDQAYINSLILSEKNQINLLKEYLDVVTLFDSAATGSPEMDSEEEIEKRFTEVTDLSDGDNTLFGNKNRAAKQLQSVARQFGSIGKSMSKKLKKNFGSITKVAKTKKNYGSRNRLLCAEIHTKRHEYQEEMIKNYILFAKKRFLQKHKLVEDNKDPEQLRLQEQALLEGPLKCINANCDLFGTVLTSYMCDKCYETQRNEELTKINTDYKSGTGRSKFYRDPDVNIYEAVKNLPSTKPNLNNNRTLYLSKSTFYYDTGASYVSEPDLHRDETNNFQSTAVTAHNQNNGIHHNNVITHDKDQGETSGKHISKFDFGTIDQNLNHNTNTLENIHLAGHSSDPVRNGSCYDRYSPDNKNSDNIQFGLNKLKINNHLINEEQNASRNELSQIYNNYKENCGTGSSGPNSFQLTMPNSNKNNTINTNNNANMKYQNVRVPSHAPVPEATYDINVEMTRPASVLSQISYNLSRNYTEYELNRTDDKRPRTPEEQTNAAGCSALQQCKTNDCPNLASVYTDFYCTKCREERQVSSIIM